MEGERVRGEGPEKKRRIIIMVGSDNDLPQCIEGLQFLDSWESGAGVVCVITASIHRNTQEVLQLLRRYSEKIDVFIIGAGWANHLTGIADAFLHYNTSSTAPVIGVAFEDFDNPIHTQAAVLSITQVPGTQVLFQDGQDVFVGREGFLRACQFAVEGVLPEIKLREPKPVQVRSLQEALRVAEQKAAGRLP